MKAKLFLAMVCGLAASAVAFGARFDVKGTVMQLRPETDSVVVAHEDIPGFMPAMTMPFQVKDSDELKKLAKGNKVEFAFVVGDSGSYAEDFRVVGNAELPTAAARSEAEVKKVREGDRVPEATLVNQNGEPTALIDDEGRWTIMTFIFSRCPIREFCPKMNENFAAIQEGLTKGLEGEVRLLSITLDPEFDRPALLKEYGKAYGADFGQWEFATGTVEQIDRLTEAFRVYVKENGVTLDHALCTALIAPDGRIEKIWRGNFWKPEDALDALAQAVAP